MPLSFEDITKEWLNDVVCGDSGINIVDLRLGPEDNGSSNRRKIHVTYDRDSDLPSALFCKASHNLENRVVLGMSGGAQCEMHFYNHFLASLSIEAPHCFFARVDKESYNSLIILEDVSPRVSHFCDDKTRIDLALAKSQMALLAEIHGKLFSVNYLVRSATTMMAGWVVQFSTGLVPFSRAAASGNSLPQVR